MVFEIKDKHVAILDVAEAAGLAFEKELNTKYGPTKVKFIKCDVTDDIQLFGAYEETIKDYKYIDVVINNAGIMNDSENFYRKEIAINVSALVTSTLKAFKLMSKDKGGNGGTIINISSIAGLHQAPAIPIYYGTKSFVLQFTNCLGLEKVYSVSGVRLLTVCFGATDTNLFSPAKTGSIDENFEGYFNEVVASVVMQKLDSAVAGVVEAYQKGESGSTWVATDNKPPADITDKVKQAYEVLESTFTRN